MVSISAAQTAAPKIKQLITPALLRNFFNQFISTPYQYIQTLSFYHISHSHFNKRSTTVNRYIFIHKTRIIALPKIPQTNYSLVILFKTNSIHHIDIVIHQIILWSVLVTK